MTTTSQLELESTTTATTATTITTTVATQLHGDSGAPGGSGGIDGGSGGVVSGDSIGSRTTDRGAGSLINAVNKPINNNFSSSNSNSNSNHNNHIHSHNNSNSNSDIGGTNPLNNANLYAVGVGHQREAGKRKKTKSRNSPNANSNYTKDHLDAWLETCLKDASNTQLSSSSEFLDYNPTAVATAGNAVNSATNMNASKNLFAQQQFNLQQQLHTSKQPASMMHNMTPQSYMHNQQHHQHQQHQHQQQHQQQQQQQQQQFTLRAPSQPASAAFPGAFNAPFSQGFQRNVSSSFMKQSHPYSSRLSMNFPSSNNFYAQHEGSQDFASLPPIVNMLGTSSEHENNSTDVLDGSGSNPNISRGFRFSDPCLLNPSDNDSKISDQNTPDQRNYIPSELENNKFFAALMEQINLLHETNSKICRNLHETKVDIEALKHAPTWGMRHRRDSISGLSTHSQPMVFGGGFGTHSPAPTFHSAAYAPGMMTDVVREVKEAARVREDALLNRVKTMVEERQWSMNECNLRLTRDIEELKSQIHHLRTDRKEANKRISHLEAENKYIRQILASTINNRHTPDIIYENETLRMRKPLPHARRSPLLNLHYGTIHQQPPTTTQSVEDENGSLLHIIEAPTGHTTELAPSHTQPAFDTRNSCSSSDGGSAGAHVGGGSAPTAALPNGSVPAKAVRKMSPPNFALVSPPQPEAPPQRFEDPTSQTVQQQLPLKDTDDLSSHELRRELTEAVTAHKEANDRIIALEKLVRKLQRNSTNRTEAQVPLANGISIGIGSNIGGGLTNTSATAVPLTTTTTTTTATTINAPALSTQSIFKWNYPLSVATSQPASRQHQAQTTASSVVSTTQAPPKLSVAGPITDL